MTACCAVIGVQMIQHREYNFYPWSYVLEQCQNALKEQCKL